MKSMGKIFKGFKNVVCWAETAHTVDCLLDLGVSDSEDSKNHNYFIRDYLKVNKISLER